MILFPNIYEMLKIMCSRPITTCKCEHVFLPCTDSSLKCIYYHGSWTFEWSGPPVCKQLNQHWQWSAIILTAHMINQVLDIFTNRTQSMFWKKLWKYCYDLTLLVYFGEKYSHHFCGYSELRSSKLLKLPCNISTIMMFLMYNTAMNGSCFHSWKTVS